jgi:hypothetical protein
MYWLISGYNTMSAEKKRNVDVVSLGNLMGIFCFVLAGLIFLLMLFLILNQVGLAIAAAVLMMAAIIYFIISSQKYDANTRNWDGSMKLRSKIVLGVTVGFLVIVFIGVGMLLYQGQQAPVYTVSSSSLKISAIYGEIIYFKDIRALSISDKLPEIQMKTNGSALGNILKGYFLMEDLGEVRLFLNADVPPYITIVTAEETIILNTGEPYKTKTLYTELEKGTGL